MAIQARRGLWADLDTSKLLPGEFAVSTDHKVVVCQSNGVIKTFMSEEDAIELVDTEMNTYKTTIEADVTTQMNTYKTTIESDVDTNMKAYKAQIEADFTTASNNASTAVTTANQANTKSDNAVSTANSAVTTANGAVNTANQAKSDVDAEVATLQNLVVTKTGIDDTVTSTVQTWSSSKTNTELALKTNTADIVDNLTSTSTTAPLSAAQGKALKDRADDNGISVVSGKLCITYESEDK